MNHDDTPTPKQSGSYAVMQQACEDALRSLETWRVKASADSPQRWLEVRRFADRFRALLAEVNMWAERPPEQAAKTRAIEAILLARGEAIEWGARLGWTL